MSNAFLKLLTIFKNDLSSKSSKNCFLIVKSIPPKFTFALPLFVISCLLSFNKCNTCEGWLGELITATAFMEAILFAAKIAAAPPKEWPIMRVGAS